MNALPKVCVLVLNYNGTADTDECIASLEDLNYPKYQVLLIDNGSRDESWRQILQKYPKTAVLENGKNLGYAGGNNAGICWALEHGYEDVFILNNDTTVDPQALEVLERFSQTNPTATILAPKVLSYEHPQVIHSLGTTLDWFRLRPKTAFYGFSEKKGWIQPHDRLIVPGSALLLKNKLLKEVGLFDEKYFLIHEDADLCLRNLKAGFRNVVLPEARIYHKESRSLSLVPFLSRYYSTRNFLYLSRTHANFFQKIMTVAGTLFLYTKNLFIWIGEGFPSRSASKAFLTGVIDFFRSRTGAKVMP